MILGGCVALLVLVIIVFDWNWLRSPLESYVTRKTHREFRISDLHVRLGLTPAIRLRDVYFANAPWAEGAAMATIGTIEFSVSLRDLFDGRILIPRVALTDADLRFERLADNRRNWILSAPTDTSPSRLLIGSLSVTRGNLRYVDRGMPFQLMIGVSTFDPAARANVSDATAAPVNQSYTTHYAFKGSYHNAGFTGEALTGDVLSFQQSGVQFPVRGNLAAGTTTLDIEGKVADAAAISAIDVRLRMAGQTLANLYPFLVLPLPASPPYRLEGHLTLAGTRFGLDEIRGQIGSTDVAGNGAYIQQSPRPVLQAKLHSKLLNIADLGPLIGVTTKSSRGQPPPTQAETNTRPLARAKERRTNGERVLPAGKFEGERLKVIDAEADFTADTVKAPGYLAVNHVRVGLRLKDAVLKLAPFDVSVAGGRVTSRVTLDAREPTLRATAEVEARRLKLGELLPSSPTIAKAHGVVGGRVNLKGAGNSIADLAAKSNGQVTAMLSAGEVSNLIDAAAGLNGGKVIRLLVGGDKAIAVRCGAAAFDVENGQGRSRVLVVDTAQTRIDGIGTFDLDQERFDVSIKPQPKHIGILSLRTPLRLYGSFRHPDYQLDKTGLALRAGGAVVLAFVAPLLALLPLIETGPGSDADCGKLLASAQQPTQKPATTRQAQ